MEVWISITGCLFVDVTSDGMEPGKARAGLEFPCPTQAVDLQLSPIADLDPKISYPVTLGQPIGQQLRLAGLHVGIQ